MRNYNRGNLVASVRRSTRVYSSMYVCYLLTLFLLISTLKFESKGPAEYFESDSDDVDESLTVPQNDVGVTCRIFWDAADRI